MTLLVADALSTIPFRYLMAAGETRSIAVDMAAALVEDEEFTTATSTLRNLDTGELDLDLAAPTVDGTAIEQVLDGPTIGFVRGQTYELVLIAEVSATSRPARRLYLQVVA
jgi:hypothetical protein